MQTAAEILCLPDSTLEKMAIPPREVADAIEAAITRKAAGVLHTSPKAAILPGAGRYMMSTLAVGNDEGLTVLKQVSVSPDNPGRGLPAINGAIMVLDAETGLLKAVLGANWITAVRTAALSVVAARRLADPESAIIAFVGTGIQASSHLAAFADIFPLNEIRAFGRGRTNLDRLCDEARKMGLRATACDRAEQALRDADLVVSSVTLDYSIQPFLDAGWLKPGAFAAITDLGIPWHQHSMAAFGTVVIDDRDQENDSERKMLPPALVQADLTELIGGQVSLVPDPDRPSCFAFRGMALGDYAATALTLRYAEKHGYGQRVAF